MPDIVYGRHAVHEALKSGRFVLRVIVSTATEERDVREVLDLAARMGVRVRRAPPEDLEEETGTRRHQGLVAILRSGPPETLSEVLEETQGRGRPPFFMLLDGIEDPHNLGAILRSADAARVDAVVVPERRAVGLTAGAHKASAGAASWVTVVEVTSIAQAAEQLQRKEVAVFGADGTGKRTMWEANLKGAVALAIGSEHDGLSRLVRERCDEIVRVPMGGHVESLNASVAAALLMFEKVRQDTAGR